MAADLGRVLDGSTGEYMPEDRSTDGVMPALVWCYGEGAMVTKTTARARCAGRFH